jgi:RimJ/RimL family protein N-acetyltransferase
VSGCPRCEDGLVGWYEVSDGEVTLSPLTLSDVDDHLAGEDDALARWLNGGRGTHETVEAHLRRCTREWEADGPIRAFGIRIGALAMLAGTVEVQFDQPYLAADQVNISYGIYPAWRGRGLAARAVQLACQHAIARGASRAVIRTDARNPASAAVARRAGFVHLGRQTEEDAVETDWFERRLPG